MEAKIIFMGSFGVGKTSLMTRLTEDRFENNTNPTTAPACVLHRPNSRSELAIHFWDTSGMERYRAINKIYYHDAVGALLTFDLTNPRTFEDLSVWQTDFTAIANVVSSFMILVGNKCDLDQQIAIEEETARSWANQNGMAYFPVSAKTGEGVVELMDCLIASILKLPPAAREVTSLSEAKTIEHENPCC
jgi:small GTP-binding protein